MYVQGKLETKRVYKTIERKYTMNEVEKRMNWAHQKKEVRWLGFTPENNDLSFHFIEWGKEGQIKSIVHRQKKIKIEEKNEIEMDTQ